MSLENFIGKNPKEFFETLDRVSKIKGSEDKKKIEGIKKNIIAEMQEKAIKENKEFDEKRKGTEEKVA
jgi:hypothetical protein